MIIDYGVEINFQTCLPTNGIP